MREEEQDRPPAEIKKALGLDVREVPRVFKTAVKAKTLKTKGQKPATAYSARQPVAVARRCLA